MLSNRPVDEPDQVSFSTCSSGYEPPVPLKPVSQQSKGEYNIILSIHTYKDSSHCKHQHSGTYRPVHLTIPETLITVHDHSLESLYMCPAQMSSACTNVW